MWERHTALHGITVCGLVPRLVPHDTTWKCRNRVNMHMHMHTCTYAHLMRMHGHGHGAWAWGRTAHTLEAPQFA